MARNAPPDQALMKMPSFKAMRSFVAAARYRNFTRAAEALCVTQAAISRQIRDLETYLGTELLIRTGRELKLTPSGAALFDAAQLSLLNIFQATERIRRKKSEKHILTLCCTPAMSTLWLSHKLKDFFSANPDIDLNVITTQHFLTMEPGINPDIFIAKSSEHYPGYLRQALFHEVIYPVCTPRYLETHPELRTLEGVRNSTLLDLNPYGRSQQSEQIDWNVWFAYQSHDLQLPVSDSPHYFSSNDYSLLLQMTLDDQGVALGWDHLVRHLVQQGRLVRPVAEELSLRESIQYLMINEDKKEDPACVRLKGWLVEQFQS
ncbi:LysR family transcriptional regulator [Pseudomonas corrugata]|uniref:LysR family transcriptional regulator n=1 Tax=Pseudomonas corrugata TaxID=47879 RepID=UPI002233E3A0|nr:LysR family transcriptional regulator [Pseudomonas corrugata]MDU9023772.1 LysR family transcriptional regulator [Pseudomonas corrugata]MDU9040270.1 LysR family transcriptional regulator [Pseudomonas corrugata]UZE04684.1 LysR family transcriptional regulator [Pseudomonas corrugata]